MTALETENQRFGQWLLRQRGRSDPLGELARNAHGLGCAEALMDECQQQYRNARRWAHLGDSPVAQGMRQAWAEWSAHNLRQLERHWLGVLAALNRVENRPKMTWLPDEDGHPFPEGRKVVVEADGEAVILRFHDYEDLRMWNRDDNTVRVAAALGEVMGRPVEVGGQVLPWGADACGGLL